MTADGKFVEHPFFDLLDDVGFSFRNEGIYQKRTNIGFLMEHLYFTRIPYYFLGLIERSRPVDVSPLTTAQVKILSNFAPTHYENNLTSLIQKSQEQGSTVYLLSLASLLTHSPTEEELKVMHFPRNTKKQLKVYQAIYHNYLEHLEKVSAAMQAPIIYLDELIKTPEQRKFFTDTMHINTEGAERFGRHIANQIRPEIAKLIDLKSQ